jgi:hypothetical protein
MLGAFLRAHSRVSHEGSPQQRRRWVGTHPRLRCDHPQARREALSQRVAAQPEAQVAVSSGSAAAEVRGVLDSIGLEPGSIQVADAT